MVEVAPLAVEAVTRQNRPLGALLVWCLSQMQVGGAPPPPTLLLPSYPPTLLPSYQDWVLGPS